MTPTATTLSLQLAPLRQEIKQFKPKIKHLKSLADITIVTPGVIKVGSQTIGMDKTGVQGLCKILKMKAAYYKQLHSQNKDAWGTLIKTLARSDAKPCTLLAANDRVIAVVENTSDIIKHDEVIDVADSILSDPKLDYTLHSTNFNGVNLNLNLVQTKPFKTGEWFGKADMFKSGIVISNNLIDGCNAKGLLERMFCTNLSYMPINDLTSEVDDIDRIYDFAAKQNRLALISDVQQRMNNLRKNNASVEEVIDVAKSFHSGSMDQRPFMQDYNSQLRLSEIAWAYNTTTEGLMKKLPLWRSTAKTPFILYDLLNWITYIARHDRRLSQDEADNLRLKGGAMLFDSPDLASIAVSKEVSTKPWILSPN